MATDTFDPIRNGVTESVVFFVKFGIAPLLFAALFGVAAVAFYLVLHYKLLPEHAKNDETKLSDMNATSKEEEEGLLYEIQTESWSFGHRVVYYGLFVSSIILTISLWLVFMFLTAFDLLPVGGGIFLSFLTLFIFWTVFFARSNIFFPSKFHYKAKSNHYFKRIGLRLWSFLREVKQKIVQKPILFTIVSIIAFFFAFISCFFISGLCVCGDPDYTSTRYQRSRMEATCKEGPPCHVYLTIPEHPTTEINVNFQTASKTSDVRVYFDTKSHNNSVSVTDYTFVQTGASFDMGSVLEITRYVHWVHLTGLEPNTTYYFIAGYGDSKENYSVERKFKTVPTNGDVHFVSGGDMGVIPVAEEIAKVMATKEPHFAVLGGDISYANSMPQCWPRWDMWLSLWESIMVTPTGYTVPLLMAIGNHEASYLLPVTKVPFFLNYFNQQSLSSIAYNAAPTERKTYHTHFIGDDTVIYILDSGHSSSAAKDSPQTEWLQSELTRDVDVANRITVYHVPMYPSMRSYTYFRSQDLREAWAPLFDQGKVKLSFENHDHSYKRTKRIKNDKEDESGTVYLGDGCLGVDVRPRSDVGLRWYEETYFPKNHFFDVYINGSNVHVDAVDHNATIFDSVNYDGFM